MTKELKTSNWILFAIMIFFVVVAAFKGWISDKIYSNNIAELIIRSRFYDLSILSFAIPMSLISLLLISKGSTKAKIITLGITAYTLFSYNVTIFTINQNELFLIYIAIVSFGTFYFTKGYRSTIYSKKIQIPKGLIKWVVLTLLFSAISGFGYWIVDSIVSLALHEREVQDMPVKAPQVLDMAFVLPFTIYGAIRLWRGEKDGLLISLIMMIFFILIGLSVISMELGLSKKTNIELDHGKAISYSLILLLNLILALITYRKLKTS